MQCRNCKITRKHPSENMKKTHFCKKCSSEVIEQVQNLVNGREINLEKLEVLENKYM